jgi:hypothetical protein
VGIEQRAQAIGGSVLVGGHHGRFAQHHSHKRVR